MSTSPAEHPRKRQWTAKIFLVVAEASVDGTKQDSGCCFENHELATHAIRDAAFKLLEPTATSWGSIRDPGHWQAKLPDQSTRNHQVVVTIKEGRGKNRYTADLLLDGKPYRAVAV